MSAPVFFVPGGLYRARPLASVHLYETRFWKTGVWINDVFIVLGFAEKLNDDIDYGFCTHVLSSWGVGFLHPTAWSLSERLA